MAEIKERLERKARTAQPSSETGALCLDALARIAELEAALSASPTPGGEWLRAGNLLYTLRQNGWRKGEPVMVNDLMIQVEAAPGSESDPEPIIATILAALNGPLPAHPGREA